MSLDLSVEYIAKLTIKQVQDYCIKQPKLRLRNAAM